MKKFEAVLLISPEISTSIRYNHCDEFVKLIQDSSGKIVNNEDWGLRELSYKIGNFSKAFYNYFQIEINGNTIENIKKNLTQNESFIRHIFVKVNQHQTLPSKLSNEKK